MWCVMEKQTPQAKGLLTSSTRAYAGFCSLFMTRSFVTPLQGRLVNLQISLSNWSDFPNSFNPPRKEIVIWYESSTRVQRNAWTSDYLLDLKATNNSSFQNYPHPDDHTIQTTNTPGFKPFTMIRLLVCDSSKFTSLNSAKLKIRLLTNTFKISKFFSIVVG